MKFHLLNQTEEQAYRFKLVSNYIPFYATFFKEYDSVIRDIEKHHNKYWQFFTNTSKYIDCRGQGYEV